VSSSGALASVGLVLALAAGCALTERSEPLEVAHYTPEHVRPPRLTSAHTGSGPPLRLGRVSSDTSLGERIMSTDGGYKVRYYDDRRWTERPEVYVRRALARALFDESGFRRALGGDAPTLDVAVLRFEEVKTPAKHAAHVELRVELSTESVLVEETVAVSEPVARDDFDDVVAALARALDRSSGAVARRVADALSTR
jgi:cholesterol transport system auxiliary component